MSSTCRDTTRIILYDLGLVIHNIFHLESRVLTIRLPFSVRLLTSSVWTEGKKSFGRETSDSISVSD